MQLKWLEDLVALARTRSFTRAAELRHVTHPAFGRRIRALEEWAGTALVEHGSSPVRLTPAGERLLADAGDLLQGIAQAHDALQLAAGRTDRTVTLATGRTLARTLVADWLPRLRPTLEAAGGELRVCTRALTETVQMLERGEADFLLVYHHPLLAVGLDARRYLHVALAQDRLVPVARRSPQGRIAHDLDGPRPTPYLAYAGTLALGRLVDDHLAHHPQAPRLRRIVECDSADALLEYVRKGAGVAWLPWSMVAAPCRAGELAAVGDARLALECQVRLYRRKRAMGELAEAIWRIAAGS